MRNFGISIFFLTLVLICNEDAFAKVISINLGDAHGCALSSDGIVKCWGYNEFGQTDGPKLNQPTMMRYDQKLWMS